MEKEAILFIYSRCCSAADGCSACLARGGAGAGHLGPGDTGWDRGGGAPSSPISFMGHWCGGGRGRGAAAWDGVTV